MAHIPIENPKIVRRKYDAAIIPMKASPKVAIPRTARLTMCPTRSFKDLPLLGGDSYAIPTTSPSAVRSKFREAGWAGSPGMVTISPVMASR